MANGIIVDSLRYRFPDNFIFHQNQLSGQFQLIDSLLNRLLTESPIAIWIIQGARLILMRIRFRDPFFFQVAKKYISFVQIETGCLCEIRYGDGARVICLFARVIQQSGFWTQIIQANVDYCYVWKRRTECTSLGPGLKRPSLRWLALVWPRRDLSRRFTWYFYSTKHPSPARCPMLLLLCVLAYDT